MTMQQVMDMMQGLQEAMAASKVEQERMKAELAASQARNEELCRANEELRRGLRNNSGLREADECERFTPPREFSTSFSQSILMAVIPNTFVGPKVTFTRMEDPEAHLTAFHTQMMLVGGSDAVRCKLFMRTLTGMAMDWFINLPDGHITSFSQLSQLFREQYLANRAPPPVSYDLFDVKRLRPPVKTDKVLGPHKDSWCEFHEAFGHHINNCLALGHQLDELVKSGFLKDYLAGSARVAALAVPEEDQAQEMPIHGEVHTISGGFSGGGPTTSQRKRYVRTVNSVVGEGSDNPWKTDLVFTKVDLRDVVPHDNDPVVISIVTAGRKVHIVLVDQGSSANVMFWSTFNKLQLSPDLLRPYTGCLYGFAGDQVKVRGYLELRTTFTDGTASRTESSGLHAPHEDEAAGS
ncbi:uncharacterized protein [Phaseolus vulgaris]|uniref:uncharacterized protein n=1 Tax=Phaseolus vulgaris TaxID=3885 RepID=UPI0035CB0114